MVSLVFAWPTTDDALERPGSHVEPSFLPSWSWRWQIASIEPTDVPELQSGGSEEVHALVSTPMSPVSAVNGADKF